MARHLAGYYSSVNLAALTAFNAIADTQLFSTGTNLRVDPTVNMLAMASCIYYGTSVTQTQLGSPSLRQLAPLDVSAQQIIPPLYSPISKLDLYDNPLKLAPNESLTFSVNGGAGGAVGGYGFVEFVDAPIKPVTGNIFTVQATGAATLIAGKFVNTALTLGTVLPAGTFNVVGLRVEGAHLLAARLSFVGQAFRPGVLAQSVPNIPDDLRYRAGNSGVFGSFNINQPPTLDCCGTGTDNAQTVYLDLIKTA